jgi:hypothetical protein
LLNPLRRIALDPKTREIFANLHADDDDTRNTSYYAALKLTDEPVDWAYEVWDELLANTRHKDNHVRAIATQVLANLAKSDPKRRMLKDFETILAVTKDEKFVTARHTLQSIWKIGAAGKPQQKVVVEGLADRYAECITEKNGTLIRYDIIEDYKKLYDVVKDEAIKQKALALIETEADPKYRKKYESVWKRRS